MSYRDRRDNVPLECKVYVGNLGSGASRNELENEFGYYGKLVNVWVARNPPGFAYVEFEDKYDARDAVKGLDGKILCGRRAKVELSNGLQRKNKFHSQSSWGPPRRDMSDVRCFTCNDRGHYARDCQQGRSHSPRRRSHSRSRSRDRAFSRSRSRSRSFSRSRSRSPHNTRPHSRSASPERQSYSRHSGERHASQSPFHSRSRSRT